MFKNGGPLGWLSKRQDRTSLSSCEAEICATSATSKKVIDLRNICQSFTELGFPISDLDKPTIIYNDNNPCIWWSHNMTSKAVQYIELCENSVCKWVQDKTVSVKHVAGKVNPADIFTKDMQNGMQFCCLHDSFMSWLSNFNNVSLLETHHAHQRSPHSVAPSAAWVALTYASLNASSYFSALAANMFCWSITAIFHLSSAGHQLLWGLHGYIPPDVV